MQENYEDILLCEATVSLALSTSNKHSLRLLWSDKDISNTHLVLVPYNPNGLHWVLIVLKVQEKKIVILDPMSRHLDSESNTAKNAVRIGKTLLEEI